MSAHKMVSVWPWMKEVYNLFSKDRAAFNQNMQKRSEEERSNFKTFCLKASYGMSPVLYKHESLNFSLFPNVI